MILKNIIFSVLVFISPIRIWGTSMPQLLRRYHIDTIPSIIHLSVDTPVNYLHPPYSNQPQVQCLGNYCPDKIRCLTGCSARNPLGWNCTFDYNRQYRLQVFPKKYYIEGWQSQFEREYVNLDSLSVIIKPVGIVRKIPYRKKCNESCHAIFIAFISSLFIVLIGNSYSKLFSEQKDLEVKPSFSRHGMTTRLKHKMMYYH
jgi:hypothetical protein